MNANSIVHYLVTGRFLNICHDFFGLQLAILKLSERVYDAITRNYSGKKIDGSYLHDLIMYLLTSLICGI